MNIEVQSLDCQEAVSRLNDPDKKPSYVVNAMGARFDICDLTDVSTHYDVPTSHKESCAVYCAFKECHAAENWINANFADLEEQCGSIYIYPDGALCFLDNDMGLRNRAQCRAFVDNDLKAMRQRHNHGDNGGSG